MADAFENMLGQPKVRECRRASVVSERVTQAYLFVGPAGSNKTQAAYALAQALLCPKGPRGPRGGSCGACDRCGRILLRNLAVFHFALHGSCHTGAAVLAGRPSCGNPFAHLGKDIPSGFRLHPLFPNLH